jgi:hypothetical protein
MTAEWSCLVLAADGDIQLEQIEGLDDWLAEGPGGTAAGSLSDALRGAAPARADPEWIDAVIAALERRILAGHRRAALLVKRATGVWYHATSSENRDSIRSHGLDWKRMGAARGIAGSAAPEWPGIFLCSDLEDAQWFARMPRNGYADVWAVRLDEAWLEGAPDASGGGDDCWMICPEPIGATQVRLLERDIPCGR